MKVFGTETLDFVADEALQMLGGYGFIADYPIERHYRDSRINRIFEGTNEINRLIIPATLMKRVAQGGIPYAASSCRQVEARDRRAATAARSAARPARPRGAAPCEMAKRVVAYTVQVLMQRGLADLGEKQQHLEILADMIIDVLRDGERDGARARADAPAARRRRQRRARHDLRLRRLGQPAGGVARARACSANELEGEELEHHLETVRAFTPFIPIRTIDTKTRIAKRLVADGGFRFI